MDLERHRYLGTRVEVKSTPAPSLALIRGTFTSTSPMAVVTLRSGR